LKLPEVTVILNVMKKLALHRVGMVLTIGLCLISTNSYGSGSRQTKKERKEARRAELLVNFQILDSLLENKSFVITADYLENGYGDRVVVPNLLNFIKVDSENAVLQTGSNYSIGYNGLGGSTAEGTIDRWQVTRNFKSLSYYVSFTVVTDIGIYDVFLDLSADTYARATITGLSMGKLIYGGHLETIGNAGIFKGQQYRY
jgi:hypothetical protein